MSDDTEVNEETSDESQPRGETSARGTMVILLIYLVIIIGIWGSVYFTLLDRG